MARTKKTDWVSLVAQRVKNLPAMWETQVRSWFGKIPWRRECDPPQYSCLKNPMDRGAWWGCKESGMTEQLKSNKKKTDYSSVGKVIGEKTLC